MKFDILTHLPWPEGTDQRQVMDETMEDVQLAEELGFHSAWFAEHHFTRYGIGSAALVILGAIAARTHQIRLGTAVLVPPLHNPIRLAEDTATVDLISNGRLDVGFGRGAAPYEYVPYRVDPSDTQERFQEAVSIIRGIWTTPDYSRDGRFYSVERANLVPRPVQQPHPPVYIAATRTPATLEFAVSQGFPTMVGLTVNTSDGLDLCRRYGEMSKQKGLNVPAGSIPFFRYVYVAETEDQTLEDVRAPLGWVADMLQWRGAIKEGSDVSHSIEYWRKTRTEPPLSLDFILENRSTIGTPEQVVAEIKKLQGQGVEYFGCNFDFGGLDHAKAMRAMKLFAEEVMPCFAD